MILLLGDGNRQSSSLFSYTQKELICLPVHRILHRIRCCSCAMQYFDAELPLLPSYNCHRAFSNFHRVDD
jgi:hypothetical protein